MMSLTMMQRLTMPLPLPLLTTLLATVMSTLWAGPVLAERACGESIYTLDCFKAYGTQLLPSHKAQLDRIADELQKRRVDRLDYYPLDHVTLIGHSSLFKPSDPVEEKALERARNTADYLRQALEDRQISDIRLVVAQAGASEPVTTNETRQGRNINRRVEIFPRSVLSFRHTMSQFREYAHDEFASIRVARFEGPSCVSDAQASELCSKGVELAADEQMVGSACLPRSVRCVIGRGRQP